MSEIGFSITQNRVLSREEQQELRAHYLAYVRAEHSQHRNLHADLDAIYTQIDRVLLTDQVARLVSMLHDASHVVLFATEASTLSLREFQQAMHAESRFVRMVSENSPDINGIRALGAGDLLVVVTTSNAFAQRQHDVIARSGAHKVVVTASEDEGTRRTFDEVFQLGQHAIEGGPLHRIYATFGVTYFFDRIFTQYAVRYDVEA